jgi:hypothetical protein
MALALARRVTEFAPLPAPVVLPVIAGGGQIAMLGVDDLLLGFPDPLKILIVPLLDSLQTLIGNKIIDGIGPSQQTFNRKIKRRLLPSANRDHRLAFLGDQENGHLILRQFVHP